MAARRGPRSPLRLSRGIRSWKSIASRQSRGKDERFPMTIRGFWSRRAFLGSSGVFAGMLFNTRRVFGLPRNAGAAPVAAIPDKLTGFGSSGNVYEELGLTTVIN